MEIEKVRPRVGVGVLVFREGKVLLGKRKGAHGVGDWAFPGGHLEFGESIEDCATRELIEETGLKALSVQAGSWSSDVIDGNKHYITLFALVDRFEGEPQLLEPNKSEGWFWFSTEALPSPLFPPTSSFFEKYGARPRTYPNKIFRRFSGLFWPFFGSKFGGNIDKSILPPNFESKNGQNNPENRQKLFIRIGSSSPHEQVLAAFLAFYQAREWERFHSPKNLVMNLASEAGELLDLFRWMTEEESYHPDPKTLEEIREEIADVFQAILYLAHKLNIDPIEAAHLKLEKMKHRYPIDKCRGKSLKYTAYETS